MVVAVSGAASLTMDLVLGALRSALLAHAIDQGLEDQARCARSSPRSPMPVPLADRLDLIHRLLLPRLAVLLLVDNAEDLLTRDNARRELADADLAAFLTAWVQRCAAAKLVVTSRYPFALPEGLQRRLRWHHLGPLSLAETRKLIWRLPALDALSAADQRRAYAMVGGHPRTLEYLDALLRGGERCSPMSPTGLRPPSPERGVGRSADSWMAGVQVTWTGRWPRR